MGWALLGVVSAIVLSLLLFWLYEAGRKSGYASGIRTMQEAACRAGAGIWEVKNIETGAVAFRWLPNDDVRVSQPEDAVL